jgi:hypothetical protein
LHGNNLDAANESPLATPKGNGSLTLFLLSPAQLFPRTAGFFFADLQFSPHLLYQLFSSVLIRTDRFDGCGAGCLSFSLHTKLTFELRYSFLSLFLVMPSLEEPALEFPLGRCSQALQLYYSMKEICPCSRQVVDLPSHLFL